MKKPSIVAILGMLTAAIMLSASVGFILVGNDSGHTIAQTSPDTPVPGQPLVGTPRPRSRTVEVFSHDPMLNGKTVRYMVRSYLWEDISKDPANGRVRISEVWLRYGTGGKPEALHAYSTYESGAFHQENFADLDEMTLIVEPTLAVVPPYGAATCATTAPVDREWLEKSGQRFLDVAAAQAVGFRSLGSASASRQRPVLPSAAIAPQRSIATVAAPMTYEREMKGEAETISRLTLEIGTSNRIESFSQQIRDRGGKLVRDEWEVASAIEIYDPGSVSDFAFKLRREGCNG